jgi:hypothetical protein
MSQMNVGLFGHDAARKQRIGIEISILWIERGFADSRPGVCRANLSRFCQTMTRWHRSRHRGICSDVDRDLVQSAWGPNAPNATLTHEPFITADAGGSNGYRSQGWRPQLQRVANTLDLAIHVCHFHREQASGTRSSTECSLRTIETVVNLIGRTSTTAGLVVRTSLDQRKHPTGKKVSAQEISSLHIVRDKFQPDWNYVIRPHAK